MLKTLRSAGSIIIDQQTDTIHLTNCSRHYGESYCFVRPHIMSISIVHSFIILNINCWWLVQCHYYHHLSYGSSLLCQSFCNRSIVIVKSVIKCTSVSHYYRWYDFMVWSSLGWSAQHQRIKTAPRDWLNLVFYDDSYHLITCLTVVVATNGTG